MPNIPTDLSQLSLGEARTCPPHMIHRKAYTRKDGTHVKGGCVPGVGGRSEKTPPSKRVLPKPEAGHLKGWTHDASAKERHRAVRKVSEKEGCGTAIRRLNLLASFTKKSSPETHRKAKADMEWLRKQGFCHLKGKEK